MHIYIYLFIWILLPLLISFCWLQKGAVLPAFTCAAHAVTSSQLRTGSSIRSCAQLRLIELMKTAPAASCRWWVIREPRAWISGQIMGFSQWLQARRHREQHDLGERAEKGPAGIFLCSALGARRHFSDKQLYFQWQVREKTWEKEERWDYCREMGEAPF